MKDRKTFLFSALCCFVYFSSYMTRHNYRAAVAEIVWSLGVTKAMASMAVTGSFLTYGIGQIFNGFIGDRIKPKTMIFLGLCATTLCNVVMSKLSSVYIMTAVWCINGFAQSMLWPPLTRIMSENLSADRYRKTVTAVITASSLATISIYFIVPLCITLSGWRAVFLLSAAFGLTAGIIWLISIDRLTESNKEPGEKEKEKTATPVVSFKSLIFGSGLIYVIIILMAHGILRDG
ncbi:MAG: MFS transporter, partial [Clostridiaceae bacterium]|nr:MFS transporter [Clostridiaceae bacterium]